MKPAKSYLIWPIIYLEDRRETGRKSPTYLGPRERDDARVSVCSILLCLCVCESNVLEVIQWSIFGYLEETWDSGTLRAGRPDRKERSLLSGQWLGSILNNTMCIKHTIPLLAGMSIWVVIVNCQANVEEHKNPGELTQLSRIQKRSFTPNIDFKKVTGIWGPDPSISFTYVILANNVFAFVGWIVAGKITCYDLAKPFHSHISKLFKSESNNNKTKTMPTAMRFQTREHANLVNLVENKFPRASCQRSSRTLLGQMTQSRKTSCTQGRIFRPLSHRGQSGSGRKQCFARI